MTADVQRELAEAPTGRVPVFAFRRENPDIDAIARALLPTVQALIADAEKRAAAGALRDLAADLSRREDAPTDAALEGLNFTLHTLRARAAALDPSGAAEGAGR